MKDQVRSTGSDANTATAPTTTVVTMSDQDSLPLEFLDLPETVLDEPKPVWHSVLYVRPMTIHESIVIGVGFLGNLIVMAIHGIMDLRDMRPLPKTDSATTASGLRPATEPPPMMLVEIIRMFPMQISAVYQ